MGKWRIHMKQKSWLTRNAQVALATGLLIISDLTAWAQTTNSFFEFVQAQSQRQYTQVPHEVLAFYYQWYGQPPGRDPWHGYDTNKHEIFGAQRYPVKGPYSSRDTAVVDWHIDQAKAHGVTCFVLSFWGQGEWEAWNNGAFSLMLDRAEKKDFKIALHWEIAPGEGQDQIDRAINELSWALKEYGQRKAFLKVNGKPVIFPFNDVMLHVPAPSWPKIIAGVRARVGDFIVMADGHQDHYGYLFDGIHSYWLDSLPWDLQIHLTKERLSEFRSWAAGYYQKGVKIARQQGRISCLTVAPGTDQRKAYKFDWLMDRLDGQVYRTLWEEAIKAKPDWIIITSWNEWPEGTEIEPSLELGDKYLKITAEYAKPFLSNAPANTPSPASLPKFAPGTTRELEKVLSGRKVGVLMQNDRLSDAEFWAAYCGADTQRLTWTNLIDAKLFNAGNFPVLVHIATVHYTSSVKTTDDVTRALVRYLREGGFLVSLPVYGGTWPLMYDDSRKGVPYAITDKLALGLDNGFEKPPNGSDLTLHAKTNVLFGLQATAPYPKIGDLRFVPTRRTRVPATEIYTPLVQLKDNAGNWQGDAVSYIEHRASSLSGGKSLYVWMRTAESFGPEVFFPSLYQFISTRLKPLPSDSP